MSLNSKIKENKRHKTDNDSSSMTDNLIIKEFFFYHKSLDTNKNEIDDENDREPGNSMDFLKLLILCVALSCVAAWLFKIIFCKLQANKKNEVSNPPSYPSLSSTRNPFTRSQNQYV